MIINNERALAYIVKVDEIRPIPNYDRVEHARTNGWWCVVKIGELSVGDKAVYFEVDSQVPSDDERFSFLEAKHYKIKTQKMCKVYSQGLLMPISLFPEIADKEVGEDVTKALRVTYAVAEDNARKANRVNPDSKYKQMAARHPKFFQRKLVRKLMHTKWGKKILFLFFGNKKDKPLQFPTHFPFIHKTDEERCENMPWVLGYKRPLVVTEKLDGTSSTYIMERKGRRRFEFYVLSRNVRQVDIDQKCFHEYNIYWAMAIKYAIREHLEEYLNKHPDLKYVCIQGESVGNVQKNPLKLTDDDLYVFNFIRSDVGRLASEDARDIVESWGMKFVPILDTHYYVPNDMEEFKQYATAKSAINPNVFREGIVLRDPMSDLSFKNVSREYLLKHNE